MPTKLATKRGVSDEAQIQFGIIVGINGRELAIRSDGGRAVTAVLMHARRVKKGPHGPEFSKETARFVVKLYLPIVFIQFNKEVYWATREHYEQHMTFAEPERGPRPSGSLIANAGKRIKSPYRNNSRAFMCMAR